MNMAPEEFLEIIRRLMEQPAAPYEEKGPSSVAEAVSRENDLVVENDEFGNLLVKTGVEGRPLVLGAHLDHPGFSMLRQEAPDVQRAEFLGGVGGRYFTPGVGLRLYPGDVPARLAGPVDAEAKVFRIETEGEAKAFDFGVWDLPAFEMEGDLIRGRACDDLIGVAAALATIIVAKRRGILNRVWAALTRAEEVGFGGALALAKHGRLPADALIISLETSREIPPVTMGGGVIVRVGDKASVFDRAGTRFLTEIAARFEKTQPGFKFQRALMSGGTCEATAYQEYGYAATGLCVALGNYHNCGPEGIAAEFVHRADVADMLDLLVAAAMEFPMFEERTGDLRWRMEELSAKTEPRLRL